MRSREPQSAQVRSNVSSLMSSVGSSIQYVQWSRSHSVPDDLKQSGELRCGSPGAEGGIEGRRLCVWGEGGERGEGEYPKADIHEGQGGTGKWARVLILGEGRSAPRHKTRPSGHVTPVRVIKGPYSKSLVYDLSQAKSCHVAGQSGPFGFTGQQRWSRLPLSFIYSYFL